LGPLKRTANSLSLRKTVAMQSSPSLHKNNSFCRRTDFRGADCFTVRRVPPAFPPSPVRFGWEKAGVRAAFRVRSRSSPAPTGRDIDSPGRSEAQARDLEHSNPDPS
jgi:hypothetical protein